MKNIHILGLFIVDWCLEGGLVVWLELHGLQEMYFNFHCNIKIQVAITIVITLNIKRDNKLPTISKRLSLQSFTVTKLQFTYSQYKLFPWPFAFTK